MPTVNFNLYDKFREGLHDGNPVDFEADTIKCAVVAAGYTVDQNLHDFFNDVTSEVSGTGYTAGGNVLAAGTVTIDGAGLVTVDADDPATWSQDAAGFADGRRAVIYKDTGVAGTSRLIGYSDDFGADQGNLNGDFFVAVGAAGLFTGSR